MVAGGVVLCLACVAVWVFGFRAVAGRLRRGESILLRDRLVIMLGALLGVIGTVLIVTALYE